MPKPLMTLFQEAESAQIMWQGLQLFGLIEIPCPSDFRLEFEAAKDCPVQGVNLKCVGGLLSIDDIQAKEMVLWKDTAPEVVYVHVRPAGRAVPTLKIWNVWRGKVGGVDVKQAWLGNAGMQFDQADKRIRIRCSDGVGEVDFDNLIVSLKFL